MKSTIWPAPLAEDMIADGMQPAAALWVARLHTALPELCDSRNLVEYRRILSGLCILLAEARTLQEVSQSISEVWKRTDIFEKRALTEIEDLWPQAQQMLSRVVGLRASKLMNPENHPVVMQQCLLATQGDPSLTALEAALASHEVLQDQEVKRTESYQSNGLPGEERVVPVGVMAFLSNAMMAMGLPAHMASMSGAVTLKVDSVPRFVLDRMELHIPESGRGALIAWAQAQDVLLGQQLLRSKTSFLQTVMDAAMANDFSELEHQVKASGNPDGMRLLENARDLLTVLHAREITGNDLVLHVQHKISASRAMLDESVTEVVMQYMSNPGKGTELLAMRDAFCRELSSLPLDGDQLVPRFELSLREVLPDHTSLIAPILAAAEQMAGWSERLARIRAGLGAPVREWTDYYLKAKRMDEASGQLFASLPQNLYARALQAAVADKMEMGSSCTGLAYPSRNERIRISEAALQFARSAMDVAIQPAVFNPRRGLRHG